MFRKIASFFFQKHRKKTLFGLFVLLVWYWWILPRPLFTTPTCMVLEDAKGDLLGARIAADGQWRFPYQKDIPKKFEAAIIEFEDRRFHSHWGIDPKGIARAINQNIRNKKIVSGGSTISMQVIRMARRGKKRNLIQKVIEAVLATRLELSYSKDEILAYYASNAPFGGNVVGLDAASWRYYGKNPKLLSWGEAATLAVLPNSPALIHPGRNRQALFEKRNRLLDRLLEQGVIDQLTNELAKEEPLPDKPKTLPRLAPHLLDRAYLEYFDDKVGSLTRLQTTLNARLQSQVNQIVKKHHNLLIHNEINNLAALVVEVESGNIVAYVGNEITAGLEHGQAVDVIKAPRSTGSILKPFLMAFALQDGHILPNSILSDVPTQLSGYRPENYHETYDGVVPLSRALSRSLNVPFIRLLSKYGLAKFHQNLQHLELESISRPASHYGLPLVLGGAEASLWDITRAYTNMSRILNNYISNNSKYHKNDFRNLNYVFGNEQTEIKERELEEEPPILGAAAIWHTYEAMQNVQRPTSEGNWQDFESSHRIAWKTGTSFGFRDAWAVGTNPKYAVGVWVGNADGEGRPGLVGVKAAAPILFDIFDLLPRSNWFDPPYDDMVQVPVCKQSGHRALDICEQDTVWIPQVGVNTPSCKYHRLLHLDANQEHQVNANCVAPSEIKHQSWFVLPPIEEHYYKPKNPNYTVVPPFREDCLENLSNEGKWMQLIYPKQAAQIYVPIDLDGAQSATVFKVAHRHTDAVIHWHLDHTYMGNTSDFHEMELNPELGKHQLTLVDQRGNRLVQDFEIIGKE